MMLLLIAIEVFAIIANLVLPMVQDATLRGRAAAIAREMEQVRAASMHVLAARSEWPAQSEPGSVPQEVKTELPAGFSFTHDDYRLVWDHWSITDAEQLGLKQSDLAGVTVIADDPRLAGMVAREIPSGPTRFTIGDRTTLVIDGGPGSQP